MTYGAAGVTVVYGKHRALDDISIAVGDRSVVAVVGGDGAGKSTLLRAIVGEVALASGRVIAPDADRIGYLSAGYGCWPALTVVENLDFVGGIYGLSGARLDERRNLLLERTDLSDARHRLARQLSGGMRRKLGFAMAVIHEPDLLVLDEPSTGVDPVSRVDLWRLISEAAAAGAAVLMSTTYIDEAERAAHLLALDEGRALASGSLDEVLAEVTGLLTATGSPVRPEWSWRHGRAFREYWPAGTTPPADITPITPNLEDAVVALSLEQRHAVRSTS